MKPTSEQQYVCFYLMQLLSNLFCNVEVFRYDENRKRVYILARTARAEEIQIEVYTTGRFDFINDETRL